MQRSGRERKDQGCEFLSVIAAIYPFAVGSTSELAGRGRMLGSSSHLGLKGGMKALELWEQRILRPPHALKIPIGNQAPAARLCVCLVAGAHQALRYK